MPWLRAMAPRSFVTFFGGPSGGASGLPAPSRSPSSPGPDVVIGHCQRQ
eukprot:CAMPEP_0180646388 /NCGR_PEP_ID=MMETSP1037_2-20121125/49601_1 /TAXON_ID=632150 /ORGANISM="Azadinium spinosum, Strain 3D9" /LENGTH=48 /DNA_ID= /DNA_START= /DNA_END= /DNA_ORIENTATION=